MDCRRFDRNSGASRFQYLIAATRARRIGLVDIELLRGDFSFGDDIAVRLHRHLPRQEVDALPLYVADNPARSGPAKIIQAQMEEVVATTIALDVPTPQVSWDRMTTLYDPSPTFALVGMPSCGGPSVSVP